MGKPTRPRVVSNSEEDQVAKPSWYTAKT